VGDSFVAHPQQKKDIQPAPGARMERYAALLAAILSEPATNTTAIEPPE
jgi:hypothetical protein